MEIIKIGNYDVNKDDVFLYIQHFGKEKTNLSTWEKMRQILHNNIFTQLKIDRHSDIGRKFSKKLDEYCEPHILRYDAISARAKQLTNAETDDEIKMAQTRLQTEMYMQTQREKLGFRQFNVNDKSICRVCNKDIDARSNDHLANVNGFDEINNPICLDCSKNNPDEYHKAFRKQYI